MIDEWEGTPWAGLEVAPPSGQKLAYGTLGRIARQRRSERLQTRTLDTPDASTVSELLLRAQGLRDFPWRVASVRDALRVPAIQRAVSLIANTTGSLALEGFRNGARLTPEQAPRMIQRPDPLRAPRPFWRDCGYYVATRGENWWWITDFDTDGAALGLIAVPPWEMIVQANPKNALQPTLFWRGVEVPRDRMRLVTYLPDDTSPIGPFQRGVGPLQLCDAAVSVAVEAQEWAANFFASGGMPSLIIKSATNLGETPEGTSEAEILRDQWMEKANNVPRVIDPGIEDVREMAGNPQGAQMLEAREYQNGDAARMFGIPGALLEYNTAGSSLTYQNVAEVYTQFVRTCLAPNYLEPLEQEFSDLLSRTTVARFNTKGFLRADPKTRAEVYDKLIPLGVMTVEQAQQEEGYIPGDIEFAPVPSALPQAIPARLPVQEMRSLPEPFRCEGRRVRNSILTSCGKLLAPDWHGKCPRCKKEYPVAA